MEINLTGIDTMPAGKEMNTLVAEAMGWAVNRNVTPWIVTDPKGNVRTIGEDSSFVKWSPSTDNGDAMAIVSATNAECSICIIHGRHLVEFRYSPELKAEGMGDTFAVAVCRATLKIAAQRRLLYGS